MRVALIYFNNDDLIGRGAGFICMAARQAGHTVDFYDTVWTSQPKILQLLKRNGYGAILLSATSLYWQRAKEFSNQIKSFSDVPIILGGPHSTAIRGELLRQCPSIDYLCVGEGEEFIVEFLNTLEYGQDVKHLANLGYRNSQGLVTVNPPRPCTDLHKLEPFDYSIFNPKSVVRGKELLEGFCYIQATRGCPFSCSYCCNSSSLELYGKSFLRTQEIDKVIAEIRYLRDNYPAKVFYFGDEMILFDKKYVTELFTRVHKELGVRYGCMFRTEMVTPDLVALMKKTGCCYVATGIECGNEQFRFEYLNRRMANSQIIEAFKLLRTIPDVWITSFNMKGYPVSFDAKLTKDTRAINRQVAPDHVQTTWFYPIPGTILYDYCTSRGLIDWDKYNKAEDYFKQSVLSLPIHPSKDNPIFPAKEPKKR